jgi:hypothetical protein
VVVNNGNAIGLIANATQTISVSATVTDSNGCADLLGGSSTIILYRSGFSSSSCFSGGTNNLNCYVNTAYDATSSCINGTQLNVTSTFQVYYFAQATDASSSFSGQTWKATIIQRDSSNSTGTLDSNGVSLNTLTAINVTTSSVNYGSLSASSTTGGVNQVATTTNAGNSTTTLQVYANPTLTSGPNTISTSSQHYATSSFTFGGAEQQLSGSAATVSGFILTAPTSTTNVSKATFWGLIVPAGTPTGTYSGTNVFSSLYQP